MMRSTLRRWCCRSYGDLIHKIRKSMSRVVKLTLMLFQNRHLSPTGIEPARTASEAAALSTELRRRHHKYTILVNVSQEPSFSEFIVTGPEYWLLKPFQWSMFTSKIE